MDVGKFAGISTLIACKGKVVHFGRYGKLNIATGTPVQSDSLFRIYSLTKPIISVGVLMLYETEHLNLDEPISKWIPAFKHFRVWQTPGNIPNATKPLETEITFRHLLTHTSGLGYGFGEPTDPVDKIYRDAKLTRPPLTLEYPLPELVQRIATLPLAAQPGATWHYSLAHDVLGYLIELISGTTCEAFLREHLFTPLGMDDTGFFVPSTKLVRFGPLYSYSEQEGLTVADTVATSPFVQSDVVPSGGGGLVASMPDYYRFMLMLARGGILDGVHILKPSTITDMTTNQLSGPTFPIQFDNDSWTGMGYGLGIGVQTMESHQIGWIGISGTSAWWYPHEDMIVIALPQALFNWEASDRLVEMASELLAI